MGCASSINAGSPVPITELAKLDAISPGCSARLRADGCIITELFIDDDHFDMVFTKANRVWHGRGDSTLMEMMSGRDIMIMKPDGSVDITVYGIQYDGKEIRSHIVTEGQTVTTEVFTDGALSVKMIMKKGECVEYKVFADGEGMDMLTQTMIPSV